MFRKTFVTLFAVRTAVAAAVLIVMLGPTARGQQSEGIKVHGDWTIEIRDPDGTLITRREFKNKLTSSGPKILSRLLFGRAIFKEWSVQFGSVSSPPCLIAGSNAFCGIVPPDSAEPASTETFKTLAVALTGAGTIELAGDAKAQRDGLIDLVGTTITITESNGQNEKGSFTTKPVAPAMSVAAGQIIQVKVVISFS